MNLAWISASDPMPFTYAIHAEPTLRGPEDPLILEQTAGNDTCAYNFTGKHDSLAHYRSVASVIPFSLLVVEQVFESDLLMARHSLTKPERKAMRLQWVNLG